MGPSGPPGVVIVAVVVDEDVDDDDVVDDDDDGGATGCGWDGAASAASAGGATNPAVDSSARSLFIREPLYTRTFLVLGKKNQNQPGAWFWEHEETKPRKKMDVRVELGFAPWYALYEHHDADGDDK